MPARRRALDAWPTSWRLAAAAGDLPIHMDGARLFNAEVATGIAGGLASPARSRR